MEVEPPVSAAASLLLKCGDGGGPTRNAAGSPNRPQELEAAASTPASLRQGLTAARARRKAGHATPSPSWKLEPSPPRPEESPAAGAADAGRRSSSAASARQLGANLWEIQDVIKVAGAGRRIRRRARRGLAATTHDDDVDRAQSSGGCAGLHSTPLMERDKLHEERCHSRQPLSPASYTSSIGAATINLVSPARSLNFRDRSREAGCNLKTSTELLKVLNRIWSLEEQHAVDVSAVEGLKLEVQHAQARIQELMQERQRYHYDIDYLVRQVTEDKMSRKNKEQEKLRTALQSLQEELEDERHLRKHSESLHRKLGKELSAMKSAFVKAVKDLEKEKKATCLLENLCSEFALGIRNYEEEVRLLKQRHVKEYEHKFDKSVVHISEAWLDERMQMQSADAIEFSERKTSVTERLSSEIQAFLHSRKSFNSNNVSIRPGDEKPDASLCRQSLESVHLNGATSAPRLAEDDEDGNSVASDLHCFELNMHGGAMQNHLLAATRQRVTGSMYSPMRRLEYSNGASFEGSTISNALPCSRKDKPKSGSIRDQLYASTPERSSRNGDKIAPIDEQNETVMTQVSRRLRNDLLKIKSEAPQHAYLGQKSHDHYPRTDQYRECSTGVLHNLRSPARHLKNQRAPVDYEISESSPTQSLGTKKNTTLKAKLLQARLEGQHARIRASGYALTSTRRK